MSSTHEVIAITDNEALVASLLDLTTARAFELRIASFAEEPNANPSRKLFCCLILDASTSTYDSAMLQDLIGRYSFHMPVIVIVAQGEIRLAVNCMLAGAFDVVELPWYAEELDEAISRAIRALCAEDAANN